MKLSLKEMRLKAGSLEKVGYALKATIIAYIALTAAVLVFFQVDRTLYLSFLRVPSGLESVPLGAGFAYDPRTFGIIDDEGNVVVEKDVRYVRRQGDVVYGSRGRGYSNTYDEYFICTRHVDCGGTGHYSKYMYEEELKKRGLAEFPALLSGSHVRLVTLEWLKRKLTFQDAPSLPFEGSNLTLGNIKTGLFFLGIRFIPTFLGFCLLACVVAGARGIGRVALRRMQIPVAPRAPLSLGRAGWIFLALWSLTFSLHGTWFLWRVISHYF